MSKNFNKKGKKKSLGHGHLQGEDEFALDLAGSSPFPAKVPPAKVKRVITINDEDEVQGSAKVPPAKVKRVITINDEDEVQGSAISSFRAMKRAAEPCSMCNSLTVNDRDRDTDNLPVCERCVLAVRKPDAKTEYPCEDCYRQLHREVEAKLQSRTLTTKIVEVLKLIPHFTADELVDTLVDLLAPPTASVSLLTSPSRVHIKDGDVEWQPLKFPIDIGYFSGTSLETSVEPWWIPKVSVAYNVTSGIVGCTLCKLQSTLSKAAVNVFHFTKFYTVANVFLLTLPIGYCVVPRSRSIHQCCGGQVERMLRYHEQRIR
jgi:hypothetical protein